MCDLSIACVRRVMHGYNSRRNYYTRMAGANKFSSLFGPKKGLKLRGRNLAKFLRIKLLIFQLANTSPESLPAVTSSSADDNVADPDPSAST